MFLSTARLKNGWFPAESAPTEDDARGDPNDVPMYKEQALCEEGMTADVAAGTRKWPFVNIFRTHPVTNVRTAAFANDLMEDLQLAEIRTPAVAHRGAAWGMILTGRDGWKVV